VHVELIEGGPIIGPERLIEEDVTIALIGGHNANAVFERTECEGLKDESFPVVWLWLAGRSGVGLAEKEEGFLGAGLEFKGGAVSSEELGRG
jgi:hypothetical protein